MTKNNFAPLNSILKKDIEEKVEESPVTAMETDVVVSEPIIISDNVDLEIENQHAEATKVEPKHSERVVGEKRKFIDIGPGEKRLIWNLQKETFDNYVEGEKVIAVDTKFGQQNKLYTVIPLEQIEELIYMTPKNLRNFYEMVVCSETIKFAVKLYYGYDLKGQVLSEEKKNNRF